MYTHLAAFLMILALAGCSAVEAGVTALNGLQAVGGLLSELPEAQP